MNRYDEMAELQRNWTPPPELASSVPRDVRLAGGAIFLIGLAAVLFLGGIALGIVVANASNRQKQERVQLSEHGQEVQAVVTRLWRTTGKDIRDMVAYRFEIGGHIYSRNVEAPRRIWKTLSLGAPLAIRFVPSNPVLNRPRDWEKGPIPGWAPYLIGLIFAGLAGLLVFLVRRQMYLLSEGRPALAVVTRHSNAEHGQKNVHYEFRLMSGALAKGKTGPRRRLPIVGDTMCIVYDRDNPRRNAAYPMDLVKLENAASRPARKGRENRPTTSVRK